MAVYTTIDNPELYFQTKLYTGNGSAQSITLDGDEDMQPDLVWFKKRSSTESHYLYDAVRGVTKEIYTNSTATESTDANSLTGFDSDGFSIGNANQLSENNETMVAWCWKESATAGFDIVSFTGNQTARTISHSLSAKPEWLLIKNREKVETWHTQHGALGATQTCEIPTTNAFGSGSTIWNDTEPTTSVFSVGTNGNINETDSGIIVYLWASKQGFSKFGKYTGNGNADGSFVYTGFRPAWLLIKKSSASGSGWMIFDTKRNPGNDDATLRLPMQANSSESTDHILDIVSNGFKIRDSDATLNTSGATFIYMAFAESPFVNSNGVPTNAR